MISLFLALFLACSGGTGAVGSYTGTVEVTEVDVASVLPGRLSQVLVRRGDRVASGDVLFQVDTEPTELEMTATEAAVKRAEAAVATTRAQHQAAQVQVATLRRELTRMRNLESAGAGSAQAVSQLEGQLGAAAAQAQAVAKGIEQAEAALEQAQAAVAGVAYKLDQSDVEAPMAGVVLSRNREPGEVVGAGMAVITLGDLDHPRLRVYVPLTTMESLSLGSPVQVRLDNQPEATLQGEVSWISSEAEFTPRDILTPEERVKQVFAVEISLPPSQGLHPGVPAEAVFGGA